MVLESEPSKKKKPNWGGRIVLAGILLAALAIAIRSDVASWGWGDFFFFFFRWPFILLFAVVLPPIAVRLLFYRTPAPERKGAEPGKTGPHRPKQE